MKKFFVALLSVVMAVSCSVALIGCSAKASIGVQTGTTGEFFVKGNVDMMFDGFSNIECKAFDNAGLAVNAMLSGQVNYVIVDNEPAKMLVEQNKNIKLIDIALTTEQYAFGVDKEQNELLAQVNDIIADIKSDGTLQAIFDKYDALEYDDDGNVIGGDDNIVGIESKAKNNDNKGGQLVVATNAAFAPYEYKKGNLFAGIDMEIAKIIADTLKLELVIEDMAFESVVTSIGKNGVDIAMAGLSVTATRKQAVNFTNPYFEGAYQVLVVKKDNTEFDNCTTKEQIVDILKKK